MQNPLVYKNIMFYLERQVRIRRHGEGVGEETHG